MPTAPSVALIVFSGEYDRCMAAFTIAAGAAGAGRRVTIFFTFWGLGLLRKAKGPGGSLLQRLFKKLMPAGANDLPLSRLNFCGMGPYLLKRVIRQQYSQELPELIKMAMDRGVEIVACQASMKIMGITRAELMDYEKLSLGDAHDFLQTAGQADVCLFI